MFGTSTVGAVNHQQGQPCSVSRGGAFFFLLSEEKFWENGKGLLIGLEHANGSCNQATCIMNQLLRALLWIVRLITHKCDDPVAIFHKAEKGETSDYSKPGCLIEHTLFFFFFHYRHLIFHLFPFHQQLRRRVLKVEQGNAWLRGLNHSLGRATHSISRLTSSTLMEYISSRAAYYTSILTERPGVGPIHTCISKLTSWTKPKPHS